MYTYLYKNPNRGRERGSWLEDMEVPGVLKKYHVKILRIN